MQLIFLAVLVNESNCHPPDICFNIAKWVGRLLLPSKHSEFWHIFKDVVFHQIVNLLDRASSYFCSGVTPPSPGLLPQWVSLSHPSWCANETSVEILLPHTSLERSARAGRLLRCALVCLDDQRIMTGICIEESGELLPAAVDTAWGCTYTLLSLRGTGWIFALKNTSNDLLITNTIYITCLLFFQPSLHPWVPNTLEYWILIDHNTAA